MSCAATNCSTEIADLILKMERAALERWGKGDPSGFLEISARQVTYFDPLVEHRVDGLPALTEYYELIRGKVWIDAFEIVEPRFEISAEMAVPTYMFVSSAGNDRFSWNCTEVYRLMDRGWQIIQTHWSIVRPVQAT